MTDVQTSTAAESQINSSRPCSRAARNSNRHQMGTASSNKSSISPVAAVASRQKENSKPHTTAPRIRGSFSIHVRFGSGRQSHGSSSMERTSTPSVSAAMAAASRFSAGTSQPAGKRCSGSVSSHTSGQLASGCQSHPATLEARDRLDCVAPQLRVSV